MTSYDRAWLGGWIALVIGIADDNLLLKIASLFMFVLALLSRRARS